MSKPALLLALTFLFALLGCTQPTSEVSITTVSPTIELITLEVTVDDGIEPYTANLEFVKGKSAYDAFDAVANLSVKQYPFGVYVYAVNGLEENKDNNGKYWQYYVNGDLPMVGVDQFMINSNATLLFKYEAQNPNIK